MREHLLGYLLEALDPHEAEEVRVRLETDPALREELEALRRCLEPLSVDAGHVACPGGLAMRTCNYVAAEVESTMVRVPAAAVRGWRFSDMLVAATVLIAASAVFFPAVNHSRRNAQVVGCQNNTHFTWLGMAQASDAHGGVLPISYSGNENAAGIWAAFLRENDYVTDDKVFICPASSLAGKADFRVPTREQLRAATGATYEEMKRFMSGSYGFPLGYLEKGTWRPVKFQNRASYALMADAPNLELAGYQTSNHDSEGQNVLFEDGSVRFMRNCRDCPFKDDIFHNDKGELAPGVHVNDSVIAPSYWPLVEVH